MAFCHQQHCAEGRDRIESHLVPRRACAHPVAEPDSSRVGGGRASAAFRVKYPPSRQWYINPMKPLTVFSDLPQISVVEHHTTLGSTNDRARELARGAARRRSP